jgi:hypothetical protein
LSPFVAYKKISRTGTYDILLETAACSVQFPVCDIFALQNKNSRAKTEKKCIPPYVMPLNCMSERLRTSTKEKTTE